MLLLVLVFWWFKSGSYLFLYILLERIPHSCAIPCWCAEGPLQLQSLFGFLLFLVFFLHFKNKLDWNQIKREKENNTISLPLMIFGAGIRVVFYIWIFNASSSGRAAPDCALKNFIAGCPLKVKTPNKMSSERVSLLINKGVKAEWRTSFFSLLFIIIFRESIYKRLEGNLYSALYKSIRAATGTLYTTQQTNKQIFVSLRFIERKIQKLNRKIFKKKEETKNVFIVVALVVYNL